MQNLLEFKIFIAGVGTILSAFWGWIGWLAFAWVVLMMVDWITGSAAAMRAGEWSSTVARDGIWHKGGSLAIVIVAAVVDMALGYAVKNAGVGFDYPGIMVPFCLIWYLLTEAGSIIENAGKLGAPLPPFFVKTIAMLKNAAEKAGAENAGIDDGGTDDGKEN